MPLDKREEILNGFLKFTLTKCMDILDAGSGSIFLFDDKAEQLVLKIAQNGSAMPITGIRQGLGEGIAGLAASHREPLLVKDINTDSRFRKERRFNHYKTNSFLSVPLEYSGELIGVINITERRCEEAFSEQDMKSLMDLCSFFAFFVYQFKRYNQDEPDADLGFSLPGKLATGLIHELNNPLDGIIRYVNLSLNCLGEESVIREYLLESKKGLNRIVKIIRSLLDFRHSAIPKPATIDVNKMLDESLFLMNHFFLSGKIKVSKHLEPNLPLIEDHGLKLVLSNILKNSCDAIGSEAGEIEVTTEGKNGFIDVRIADTGPGIPVEIRNKIFEPFFTTKEMGKGSGLGLAICLNIIERYNGFVFLETGREKGSAFTIRVPLNGRYKRRLTSRETGREKLFKYKSTKTIAEELKT